LRQGLEIFKGRKANIYGKWLGERYNNKDNIKWILGGDRQLIK